MANDPKKPTKPTMTEAQKAARYKEQAAAFVKLVNKRVSKVLGANVILKKLANPRNYKFTVEQVDKIEVALQASNAAAIKSFRDALKGGVGVSAAPNFDVTK